MNDILTLENLTKTNIFLYDIDFVDGALVEELPRRRKQK